MESGILDPSVFVQMKRDLRVAFDAGHRIDNDSAFLLHGYVAPASGCSLISSCSLLIRSSLIAAYDPNRVFNATSGLRPSSNSRHYVINCVGGGRASWNENIDLDELRAPDAELGSNAGTTWLGMPGSNVTFSRYARS